MTPNTRSLNGTQNPAPAQTDETKRRRRRWTPEQKAELLSQFAASGLNAAEFCRRTKLARKMLWNWQRRPQTTPAAAGKPAFAEVRLAGPMPTAEVVIGLGADLTLRVPAGLNVHWVGQLLQAVRASSRSC
jgi:hypothetical protein